MAKKALTAGFTGDIPARTGVSAQTRQVADRIRDEAGMVATHAVDHPAVTGSAVAAVGLVAFALGYVMGSSSGSSRRRWYR